MVSESATDEGADHRRQPKNGSKGTEEPWTVFEKCNLRQDLKHCRSMKAVGQLRVHQQPKWSRRTRDEDAGRADSREGAAEDEDVDVVASATHNRANLEHGDSAEEDVLGRPDAQNLSEDENEGSLGCECAEGREWSAGDGQGAGPRGAGGMSATAAIWTYSR